MTVSWGWVRFSQVAPILRVLSFTVHVFLWCVYNLQYTFVYLSLFLYSKQSTPLLCCTGKIFIFIFKLQFIPQPYQPLIQLNIKSIDSFSNFLIQSLHRPWYPNKAPSLWACESPSPLLSLVPQFQSSYPLVGSQFCTLNFIVHKPHSFPLLSYFQLVSPTAYMPMFSIFTLSLDVSLCSRILFPQCAPINTWPWMSLQTFFMPWGQNPKYHLFSQTCCF